MSFPPSIRREIWGISFPSPIMLASGTAGFGEELLKMGCLKDTGAVVSKAVTLKPRAGNPPPRIMETPMGLLNSIGLANPGAEHVVGHILPRLENFPCPLIMNVAGETVEEFAEVVRVLEGSDVHVGYEINVSCPNVARGGATFGADPSIVGKVAGSVADATGRPFSVKLTPNGGGYSSGRQGRRGQRGPGRNGLQHLSGDAY